MPLQQRHFIIFRRTDSHCAVWLVRAATLLDACIRFALHEGAEQREDGVLEEKDGSGGIVRYEHPLAYIESAAKACNGGTEWNGWEIRELQEPHWEAGLAEVFCSENPSEVEEHIERCRPLLRKRHPRSRAKGFVWYLKEGPLVTFYRQAKSPSRDPIEILGRYFLPWQTYPEAHVWDGGYDDILAQMAIDYPLP